MRPLCLKWKMDWAFNSLSHFICKITLVTLLFTWSTGTYQEMLHFAREGGTVVLRSTAHGVGRGAFCMILQRNARRSLALLQPW